MGFPQRLNNAPFPALSLVKASGGMEARTEECPSLYSQCLGRYLGHHGHPLDTGWTLGLELQVIHKPDNPYFPGCCDLYCQKSTKSRCLSKRLTWSLWCWLTFRKGKSFTSLHPSQYRGLLQTPVYVWSLKAVPKSHFSPWNLSSSGGHKYIIQKEGCRFFMRYPVITLGMPLYIFKDADKS